MFIITLPGSGRGAGRGVAFPTLGSSSFAGPDFLYLNLNPGFAESGSRICWIRIQKAFLNPKTGFAESGSRLGCIQIQDFLNHNSVFAEFKARLCRIRIQDLLNPKTALAESGSMLR
jgi:hypothetical protein